MDAVNLFSIVKFLTLVKIKATVDKTNSGVTGYRQSYIHQNMSFNHQTLEVLTRLGYRYLVVDPSQLVAYARRTPTPRADLDFLSLVEFEIDALEAGQATLLAMYNVEVALDQAEQ